MLYLLAVDCVDRCRVFLYLSLLASILPIQSKPSTSHGSTAFLQGTS